MSIAAISEADILTRTIDLGRPDLSVEAALSLCWIDFAPEDHDRMRHRNCHSVMAVSHTLRQQIIQRAGDRFEWCQMPRELDVADSAA